MSGSELHDEGKCRPCIFFHKERGCSNGDQCEFCHKCAPDAVAKRKKERKDEVKKLKRENTGSQNHPDGCRPCAFFHPKEGKEGTTRFCAAASECHFCHLCPPGELARRKKTRQKALRHTISADPLRHTTPADLNEDDAEEDTPIFTHPKDTGTTFVPGVGVVDDDILEKAKHMSKPRVSTPKSQSLTYVAGVGVIRNSALEDTACLYSAPEGTSGPRSMIKTWSHDEENPAVNIPRNIGSKSHPSECKPCAFFHKEQGCIESDKCTFCHACPFGAARSSQKKKKKAMKLLKKLSDSTAMVDSDATFMHPPGLDPPRSPNPRDTVSSVGTLRMSTFLPTPLEIPVERVSISLQGARKPPGLPAPYSAVESTGEESTLRSSMPVRINLKKSLSMTPRDYFSDARVKSYSGSANPKIVLQ